MSAQIESTSGSIPCVDRAVVHPEHVAQRRTERGRRNIVVVVEAIGHQHRRQVVGDGLEQRRVPGLGDCQTAVRVLYVAQQMHAAAGVVPADDGRADERGAAERKQVVGCVVDQHRDVAGTVGRQLRIEERREPHRLRGVLRVRPLGVAELDRDPVARLLRVAPEQRRRVRGDEGSLARGRLRRRPRLPARARARARYGN